MESEKKSSTNAAQMSRSRRLAAAVGAARSLACGDARASRVCRARDRPGDGVEEEGRPGHEPDEAEPPEEPERGGVVVVGNAQVEVAEQVLVHEVEPEPAADVAVGGQRDLPVASDEVEGRGMALGGVGEAGEDVPRGGDGQEDEDRGEGVELAEAGEGSAEASGEEEVEQ